MHDGNTSTIAASNYKYTCSEIIAPIIAGVFAVPSAHFEQLLKKSSYMRYFSHYRILFHIDRWKREQRHGISALLMFKFFL